MNLMVVGTSRRDVPAREAAGGIVAPLHAARTAQRAVPTGPWFQCMRESGRGLSMNRRLVVASPQSATSFSLIDEVTGHRTLAFVKTFGLTGGIGMGKSTAADLLRQRGLPVVDSDIIARQVVEPGQPALAEVQRLFGDGVVGADGRLRRDDLARRVFADSEARRRLEEILHPRIRAVWQAQLLSWRTSGHPAAVAVIPLLFETEASRHFDATLCVACSATTQRQRLRTRGWTDEQIDQRLAAQWPAERKMALADYVIWTEGCLNVHEAQLQRIFR